jgi:hypothetical protein
MTKINASQSAAPAIARDGNGDYFPELAQLAETAERASLAIDAFTRQLLKSGKLSKSAHKACESAIVLGTVAGRLLSLKGWEDKPYMERLAEALRLRGLKAFSKTRKEAGDDCRTENVEAFFTTARSQCRHWRERFGLPALDARGGANKGKTVEKTVEPAQPETVVTEAAVKGKAEQPSDAFKAIAVKSPVDAYAYTMALLEGFVQTYTADPQAFDKYEILKSIAADLVAQRRRLDNVPETLQAAAKHVAK